MRLSRHLTALFFLSAASLFLELALIRWLSTEIRIFGHVKNVVLISCFVGLAAGFPLKRWKLPLWLSPLLQAILLLCCLPEQWVGPWTLRHLARQLQMQDVYEVFRLGPVQHWLPGVLELLLGFALVLALFLPIGQRLGEMFREASVPLRAYSANVAGSLVGVIGFTFCSLAELQPPIWFALSYLLLVTGLRRRSEGYATLCLGLSVGLLTATTTFRHPAVVQSLWSPYQKVEVWLAAVESSPAGGWLLRPGLAQPPAVQFHMLSSNDIAMMWLLDLSTAFRERHQWLNKPGKIEWYDFPYHLHREARKVLIIGSGGGNDVAAALRHGVESVDAVEIDPIIVRMGTRYHPEHPYSDPRVHPHVTDGRHFLQQSNDRYDLVIFGQLDNTDWNSMSNLSNIRMDSYIYTVESLRAAFRLVKPDGLMVVNFGASDFWGHRVMRMLHEATGQTALGVRNELPYHFPGQENTYVVGDQSRVRDALATDDRLRAWVEAKRGDWQATREPYRVTDDWPYWYLVRPAIPPLHLVISGILVLFSAGLLRILLPESFSLNPHFWALGAAFSLLETHLISKTALLFGSTWMVNGFVIGFVLLMILFANVWVETRGAPPYRAIFPCLLAVCMLQWALPPGEFLSLGLVAGGGLALILYTLPVFFAGLAFARSFQDFAAPDRALTANLLGAVTGGFLEMISYITGLNALMLLVVGLYGLAWWRAPR